MRISPKILLTLAGVATVTSVAADEKDVFNPIVAVMNQNLLNTLPDNLKTAVMEAAREATAAERATAVEAEAKAFEALEAQGVKFTECPDGTFTEAVKPVWEDFIAKYPDTKEILDSIVSAQ